MTNRTASHLVKKCAAMLAVAIALACTMAVLPAYANIHLNAPTTVSDDITRLHVNKLDADTHEYVAGAKMAIIEEETGVVVDEWVTGTDAHENEKGLNVNVVYILRELQAPEGYDAVEDVRFIVNETEGTGITILSQGNDSELVESYKVNLYDKPHDSENVIEVTQTRATPSSTSDVKTVTTTTKTTKAAAPKTGDETPLSVVALLVGVGVLLIILLQFPKHRMED